MSGCRISRVIDKRTGRQLVILAPRTSTDAWLMHDARQHESPNLFAYAIVSFSVETSSDGSKHDLTTVSYRVTQDWPHWRMLPGAVDHALRDYMTREPNRFFPKGA